MTLTTMTRHMGGRFGYQGSPGPMNGGSPTKGGPPRTPPPRLRGLLLVAAIVFSLVLLFLPAMRTSPPLTNLSFSAFSAKVEANQVATATIDHNGAVTGQLKGGGTYKSAVVGSEVF